MGNCAACGKELGFRDRHDSIIGYSTLVRKGFFPEFRDKKICLSCQVKLIKLKKENNTLVKAPLNENVSQAILWQKGETVRSHISCKESFGNTVGRNGYLVITDQRILFANEKGIMYAVCLEDIIGASSSNSRFSGETLTLLNKDNRHKDFWKSKDIHLIIPEINSAISNRKNELLTQKEKEHLHIVLDFSSLKDVMSKGGLVMTTCRCPNCSSMVGIPESGKVLVCQYCGTPIKPIDIFEKIKSLIQ